MLASSPLCKRKLQKTVTINPAGNHNMPLPTGAESRESKESVLSVTRLTTHPQTVHHQKNHEAFLT